MNINDVKYPICPVNIYFEGDEDKCDASKCDWDIEFRCCNEACKRIKDENNKPKITS